MGDFLSFHLNPEFVAAFRFMFWSLFYGVAMVAYSYYRDARDGVTNVPRHIPLGVLIIFVGIATHQLYYWLGHRSKAHDHEILVSILSSTRHITSVLLIIMCVGGVFYMRNFLENKFGRYWWAVGSGAIVTLWCIGYGDAAWL